MVLAFLVFDEKRRQISVHNSSDKTGSCHQNVGEHAYPNLIQSGGTKSTIYHTSIIVLSLMTTPAKCVTCVQVASTLQLTLSVFARHSDIINIRAAPTDKVR